MNFSWDLATRRTSLEVVEGFIAPVFFHRHHEYVLVPEQLWLSYVSEGRYACCHPVGFCRLYHVCPRKASSRVYGREDSRTGAKEPVLGCA